MARSLEQQIGKLRRAAQFSWISKGLLVLALGFIALGVIGGQEIFFLAGAFAGLAAAAAREAAPHWRNAIAAIHDGRRSSGHVSIAIARDPTSFDRHVATVRDESADVWEFEFSPRDWQPSEGDFEAAIFYVRDVEWPALVMMPEGLLFPAFTPRKSGRNG